MEGIFFLLVAIFFSVLSFPFLSLCLFIYFDRTFPFCILVFLYLIILLYGNFNYYGYFFLFMSLSCFLYLNHTLTCRVLNTLHQVILISPSLIRILILIFIYAVNFIDKNMTLSSIIYFVF